MMFKKITHLMFSVALVFGLIGCGSEVSTNDNVELIGNQNSSNQDNDETIDTNSQSAEDKTSHIITITGDNPLEVTQGETFSDPGATATDDKDGIVTVTPTGTVEMDSEGSYNYLYSNRQSR